MHLLKTQLKWDPKAGPILTIALRKKQIGLALFCHRREERCIKIFGHSSPLCARCMGICIGAVTATSLNMIGGAIPIWVKIIFVVPLVADGFTQLLGKRQSNNTLRLVTGFLFSAAFILSTI